MVWRRVRSAVSSRLIALAADVLLSIIGGTVVGVGSPDAEADAADRRRALC